MASKPVNQLSAGEKEQLAVSYAAFVLSGQGAPVTADNINNVLKAANLTASGALVKAFAKTLASRSVNDFLGSVGGGESAPVEAKGKDAGKAKEAPKDAGKDAKGAKDKAAPPPPPPPPAQEEEDVDMGDLFG